VGINRPQIRVTKPCVTMPFKMLRTLPNADTVSKAMLCMRPVYASAPVLA
jgi:hypothetical protein